MGPNPLPPHPTFSRSPQVHQQQQQQQCPILSPGDKRITLAEAYSCGWSPSGHGGDGEDQVRLSDKIATGSTGSIWSRGYRRHQSTMSTRGRDPLEVGAQLFQDDIRPARRSYPTKQYPPVRSLSFIRHG